MATITTKLVLVFAILFAGLSAGDRLLADDASAAPDPLTCLGYSEKRVFLESQSWWTAPGKSVDFESEHVHLGACFPHAQSISGVVEFDVRVMVHNVKGTLNLVRIAIGSDVVMTQLMSTRCATTDCTYWFKLKLDTAAWPRDGRQELRFTANVERDDGSRQYQSTGWQAYFANGNPVSNYRSSDLVVARGWYDLGFGYANATFEAPFTMGPVSGIWRPQLSFSKNRHLVTIDPNFHAANRGTIVAEGTGSGLQPAIDTTKLSDGWHKLVVRTDDVQTEGVNSGVLVLPFEVRNGSTPPPPGDTQAPSAPGSFRAVTVREASVELAWSASTDNVGVTGYRIYRGGSQVGAPSGTTYTATGLTCATAYTFGVAAQDAAGNVSSPSPANVTTAACSDTAPPSAPSGLAIASSGPSNVTLSWTASTDNAGIAGYDVYRDAALVATVTGTGSSVTGVDCATGHILGVVAFDAAGNRSSKSTRSVRCTWTAG